MRLEPNFFEKTFVKRRFRLGIPLADEQKGRFGPARLLRLHSWSPRRAAEMINMRQQQSGIGPGKPAPLGRLGYAGAVSSWGIDSVGAVAGVSSGASAVS